MAYIELSNGNTVEVKENLNEIFSKDYLNSDNNKFICVDLVVKVEWIHKGGKMELKLSHKETYININHIISIY